MGGGARVAANTAAAICPIPKVSDSPLNSAWLGTNAGIDNLFLAFLEVLRGTRLFA